MDELDRRRSHLAHCRAYHQQDLHSNFQDAILPDDGPRNRRYGESRQRVEKQRGDCLHHGNTIHKLQLQQLGRHWNRLLFGQHQSSFNHNEWTDYGDSLLYA